MIFDALLYRLLVIGEAVKALPTNLLDREPDIPWGEVAAYAICWLTTTTVWIRRSFGGPSMLPCATCRLLLGA